MATRLQALVLGGRTVWVEVADVEPEASIGGKTTRTSSPGAAGTQAAAQALTQVDLGSTLTAILAPVHDTLQRMSPDEVSVELSLGMKGEVGFFVAKGEGNAALKISAKWTFGKGAKGGPADAGGSADDEAP